MNSVKTQAMMWTLTLINLSITAGKSSSHESLLKRFIQHLFQLPGIQSKITEQMSTAATVAANAVIKNNSDSGEETVSAQTATFLSQSVEKLAFFRRSRAANSVVRGRIRLNVELMQALMYVIVTCKYKC